jgi:hypothetical protein
MQLLKEVATISGKPGLYRILKPTRTGVIVESLDDKKQRLVINKTTRVSVLSDISVYTRISNDHMMPLSGIFTALRGRYGKDLGLDPKTASDAQLADFFVKVAPEYDRQRVHSSDIQKIIAWYNILTAFLPEIFLQSTVVPATAAPVTGVLEPTAQAAPETPAPEVEEPAAEAPKKKPRARKKAVAEEAKAE